MTIRCSVHKKRARRWLTNKAWKGEMGSSSGLDKMETSQPASASDLPQGPLKTAATLKQMYTDMPSLDNAEFERRYGCDAWLTSYVHYIRVWKACAVHHCIVRCIYALGKQRMPYLSLDYYHSTNFWDREDWCNHRREKPSNILNPAEFVLDIRFWIISNGESMTTKQYKVKHSEYLITSASTVTSIQRFSSYWRSKMKLP